MDEKEAEARPVNGNHFSSNRASEVSPTLGCSIEISRDICCRYVVCRMSVVCQINCVGGITYGPRACSKSFLGG